ncbi:type IV pilus assembly protein PilM [Frigoribacterium sp. 2-23]|uniref:type IV pilus assembly protein PilM n=1 Tax=Frigoribacterium sp. 2-23 TaxID=3415006 RepID=UPI003C70485B
MSKSIVGVDIGSRSLRAVEVADVDKARPTLLRFYEVPLAEGAASRGEVLEPQTVASSLRQLWSSGGFKSKRVVLGMGNQRVLARDLTVQKASKERIRELLPFQVQEMLPVPVGDALLDFYPYSESEGENGPVVNGLLIAAVKDAVLGNVRASKLAGLSTMGVDLIPFANTRLLVNRPQLQGTVALIEIGHSTSSVIIVTNGAPQFVRIIPSGGDDITQAVMAKVGVGVDEAVSIKRQRGLSTVITSPAEQNASAAIFESVNDLLGSFRNTVQYFVNTRPTETVSQIILTGGGASLIGLPDALAEVTRLPVVVADPFSTVALAKSIDEAALRSRATDVTTALGLALGSAA